MATSQPIGKEHTPWYRFEIVSIKDFTRLHMFGLTLASFLLGCAAGTVYTRNLLPTIEMHIVQVPIPFTTKAVVIHIADVVPLRFNHGAIFAVAKVNGTSGIFMLDTGGSVTLLSPQFAARIKIKPEQDAPHRMVNIGGTVFTTPKIKIRSVQIGKAEVRDIEGGLYNVIGDGIDGIIGLDVLGHYNLGIDFGMLTLSLQPVKSRLYPR